MLLAVAPDAARFRQWVGPNAPEWGAAIAFPESRRIVMQGRRAGSDAGDPLVVVRHELAHLALHEALGDLPPRWFDEGYASWAAGEWSRDETLEANVSLAIRGMPSLDELEDGFVHGAGQAEASYALAYRAVAELAALDPDRGLTLFFQYWKQTGKFDPAVRQAYGMTAAAFEKRWQERTRRRYGALALFADLTLTTVLFLAILLPLYVVRRRRDRRRMELLIRADVEAERRAREQRILEQLLGATSGDGAPASEPALPDNPEPRPQ